MINMKTFESLCAEEKNIVMDMSNAAREELKSSDICPAWDDSAAIFDEACAVFFKASKNINR